MRCKISGIVIAVITFSVVLVMGVVLSVLQVQGDSWGEKYVVPGSYLMDWTATDEKEQVFEATMWVHDHIVYTEDIVNTWASSDQLFDEIRSSGSAYDDCDGYAILLCALIRFNIGVPANRVWVVASTMHAQVKYIDMSGSEWKLEPTWSWILPGGTPGIIIEFNDQVVVYHITPIPEVNKI